MEMNSGHICLFPKGFCMVHFGDKGKMRLPYYKLHRGNLYFWWNKAMYKSNKIAPRKKVASELLHHRLGQTYTRLLMAGDASNVWKYI